DLPPVVPRTLRWPALSHGGLLTRDSGAMAVTAYPGCVRVLRVFHSAVVDAWRARERELRRLGHDVHLITARRWNEGGSDVLFSPAKDEQVEGTRTFGRHPALFLYDPRPIWRAMGQQWDVIDIHEEPFALATAEILTI